MAPIRDPENGPGRLAAELRHGRGQRGLTRPALAEEIGRSVATVQRAEAGRTRPPWPVVKEIAKACRLDTVILEGLWKEAALRTTAPAEAPHLKLVRTPADLAAALRREWQDNGEPSLRQMEERAEARARDFTPLSRMSAWRIRERKQPTASISQLHAYLVACEVPEALFSSWAEAWHRVRRYEVNTARQQRRDRTAPQRAVASQEATANMAALGLRTLDPFPGLRMPWTAQCMACGKISRFRYASIMKNGDSCPVCAAARSRPAA
ncbi:helix-turn-helix domain-containing protein [Streptomyces caniscabiei]|uniref:helix-turn-helix domain-containing protein n=1 Tax=Streptomyces caniscabiei TaxID=2746961 RepID=UPI001F47DF8D|nr:helix-turn-helix transcriptional regulator [Streptomyces caniscabiei]